MGLNRPVNVGRTKAEFDALILDIANLDTDEIDRLPNRLNLSSRGLDIDSIMCPVCNSSVESSVHTFFTCDTTSDVWHRVHTWTDSMLLLFSSYDDWDIWLQSWQAPNSKKDRAYSIFAATCWTLWRFRNNITFDSQSMRKSDIFDYICLASFSWLKIRGNFCISWNDWLQSPL
ncbi:RNA-directed DNA polymerase, eukaryota [Tanacetum coccineum]